MDGEPGFYGGFGSPVDPEGVEADGERTYDAGSYANVSRSQTWASESTNDDFGYGSLSAGGGYGSRRDSEAGFYSGLDAFASRSAMKTAEQTMPDSQMYGDLENPRRRDLQKVKPLDRKGPPGQPAAVPGAGTRPNPPSNPRPNPNNPGSQQRVSDWMTRGHTPASLSYDSQSHGPRSYGSRPRDTQRHYLHSSSAAPALAGTVMPMPSLTERGRYAEPEPLSRSAIGRPHDPRLVPSQSRSSEAARNVTQEPHLRMQQHSATPSAVSQSSASRSVSRIQQHSSDQRTSATSRTSDSSANVSSDRMEQLRVAMGQLMARGYSREQAAHAVREAERRRVAASESSSGESGTESGEEE